MREVCDDLQNRFVIHRVDISENTIGSDGKGNGKPTYIPYWFASYCSPLAIASGFIRLKGNAKDRIRLEE